MPSQPAWFHRLPYFYNLVGKAGGKRAQSAQPDRNVDRAVGRVSSDAPETREVGRDCNPKTACPDGLPGVIQ